MTAALLVGLGLLIALLSLATAILGLISQRRIRAAAVLAEQSAGKLQEISVSVDGNMAGLFARIDQLIGSMHAQGATVPPPPPPPDETGEKLAGA